MGSFTQKGRPERTLDPLDEAATRVLNGDDSAFEAIVEATSPRLVRLAARIMGSLEEGEDVVQEAYLRAYRSLADRSFDRRARVETWLRRITTNAALDALRSRRRRPAASPEEPVGVDGAAAEARVALGELGVWLRDLPPDQRVALTLKAVEGMSSGEVAGAMGVSEGAVEQLLVRARAALRKKRED
jgi:RNA polymerase sigma-70 factor (ECF subfamily)